jgi:hypothetical protein
MNVLAFTASKNRPFLLRHCVMQMSLQTYPLTHGIFLNSDTGDIEDFDYTDLLSDIPFDTHHKIKIFGDKTLSQHQNHIKAITQVPNWQDFDLFLKIDDDDIYRSRYVESVVKSYEQHKWDFSGTVANGVLNGNQWNLKQTIEDLRDRQEPETPERPYIMPPTFAFNKKALDIIMKLGDIQGWEDPVWYDTLTQHPDIRVHKREESHFSLHIHGQNVSTSHHYKND